MNECNTTILTTRKHDTVSKKSLKRNNALNNQGFDTVKKSAFPNLNAPSQNITYQRKQTLYHNGDLAQSIFRMKDGLVRITRMTPEGRTLTVRHVVPGDFFGEEAFMEGQRIEIAEALTLAEVEAVNPKQVNEGDLVKIVQSLSSQMQRLMDYEYHLQTGDLRQRVSRYLLSLAETPLANRNEAGKLVIAATHELIAEGTASTRESVSKIITELRHKGMIESGYRSIIIIDSDALDDVAQGI